MMLTEMGIFNENYKDTVDLKPLKIKGCPPWILTKNLRRKTKDTTSLCGAKLSPYISSTLQRIISLTTM